MLNTFENRGRGKEGGQDKIRFEWADIIYDMSKARHF